MSLMVPQTRLNDGYEVLIYHWQAAGDRWRDEARRRFEEDFIHPAGQAVNSAASAMGTMGEALASARAACS
ncbi:MAG: hypothetical protein AAGB34_01730 [Planctomycetota bacterium]